MEQAAPGVQQLGAASAPIRQRSLPLSAVGQGSRLKQALSSNGGTDIEHWWAYEEQRILGIGTALPNYGTGNLIVSQWMSMFHNRGLTSPLNVPTSTTLRPARLPSYDLDGATCTP